MRHDNMLCQYRLTLNICFSGAGKKVSEYNLPREVLKQYFPCRHCFCFPRPAPRGRLMNLDSLPVEDLNEEFFEVCQAFCDYIYRDSPVKAIYGQPMNGNSMYTNTHDSELEN